MDQHRQTGDNVVPSAHTVVSDNLNTIEAGVDKALDTAMDGTKEAVHELRTSAQQVTDQAFNRVMEAWQSKRPRIEAYMAEHPWLVLGGLFLIGYLFSGPQRSRT
jgi:ElaB/YqjD/DUF883 family membrane-anchored ribosome-binding protein